MIEKKKPYIANLPLNRDSRIVAGVFMGEFYKAKREGRVSPQAEFHVFVNPNTGQYDQIQIKTTREDTAPSLFLVTAGLKLVALEQKGLTSSSNLPDSDKERIVVRRSLGVKPPRRLRR